MKFNLKYAMALLYFIFIPVLGCATQDEELNDKTENFENKIYVLFSNANLLLSSEKVGEILNVKLKESRCIMPYLPFEKCGYRYNVATGHKLILSENFYYGINENSSAARLAFHVDSNSICLTKPSIEKAFNARLIPNLVLPSPALNSLPQGKELKKYVNASFHLNAPEGRVIFTFVDSSECVKEISLLFNIR